MAADFIRRRADGFDVYARAGDPDLWPILEAYRGMPIDRDALMANFPNLTTLAATVGGGAMTLTTLSYTNPKRLVWKAEVGGKSYVLKWARMGTFGLKRLFPGGMGLTYYTRLMRLVGRAVERGCAATQDVLMVAERWIAPFRLEVLVLLEYVEGTPMGYVENAEALKPRLREAVAELLRFGLTLDDLSPFNFLATETGIRAIDLSCRPPTFLHAAKMAAEMNKRYGLDLPVNGVLAAVAKLI